MSNGTEKDALLEALDAAKEIVKEWEGFVSQQEKMKFREHLYQVMKQGDLY